MTKLRWILPLLVVCVVVSAAIPAAAWRRSPALQFAVLPNGSTGPEGLAVGPDGNVYVATFGFNAAGPIEGQPNGQQHGQLFVFTPHGKLVRQVTVGGSSTHLLGIGFDSKGTLLVIDFGAGQVLSVDPVTGASSAFITLPAGTTGAGLNALTFDKAGNVYVSDSFLGVIWKTGPAGGVATKWASDPLLTTKGVPPFGANGIVFNHAETAMFVANTGNDTILKIDAGNPTAVSVFTNSINGADGIAIDEHDNLWVAANQEDEIVVVDQTGKAIAKLGDFNGVEEGVPRGLLFPASPAFSADGHWLFVTNLALDLRIFDPTFNAIDSGWTHLVTRYTVSKIEARIPPLGDRDKD